MKCKWPLLPPSYGALQLLLCYFAIINDLFCKELKKVDYNRISHAHCINLYRKLFKISTLAFIFLTDYCLLTPVNVVEKQGGSLVHKCCFEIFFYLFKFYNSLWGTCMQMSSICLFCAYAPRITLISVCRQSITKISERRATSMGSMVY